MSLTKNSLADSLAIIAATTPASFKARMQATGAVNRRIFVLEEEMGLRLSPPTLNPERAAAKLLKLEAQRASFTEPAALATATATAPAAPAIVEKVFVPCGDRTLDAAVKAAGCYSLDHYKVKTKRDNLAALAAGLRPGGFTAACIAAKLAEADAELKRFQ